MSSTAPLGVSWRECAMAGLANAAIKTDALLVLAAAGVAGAGGRWPELATFLYLISPVIRAAQDWAHLFYFDLKRLEPGLLVNVRARYDRLVSALAWWMGAGLWIVGGLLITCAFQPLPAAYLFLLPILLVRSVLSIAQLRAFVAGRYGAALASAAVWIAAAMVVLGGANDAIRVLLAAGGPILAAAWPRRSLDRTSHASEHGAVLPAVTWLARLGAVRDPIRLRAVQVAVSAGSGRQGSRTATTTWWATRRIARRVATRLGDAGVATAIWPDRVAWHERGAAHRISREWLVRIAAGRLTDLLDTGVVPDGARALQHLHGTGPFGSSATPSAVSGASRDVVEGLTRRFEQLCPRGAIYNTDVPPPAWLTALPSRDKRRILTDAVAFARDFRPAHHRSCYDVTALAVGGAVRVIFVQQALTERGRRGRWRALVRDANVAAARQLRI